MFWPGLWDTFILFAKWFKKPLIILRVIKINFLYIERNCLRWTSCISKMSWGKRLLMLPFSFRPWRLNDNSWHNLQANILCFDERCIYQDKLITLRHLQIAFIIDVIKYHRKEKLSHFKTPYYLWFIYSNNQKGSSYLKTIWYKPVFHSWLIKNSARSYHLNEDIQKILTILPFIWHFLHFWEVNSCLCFHVRALKYHGISNNLYL